MLRRLTAAPRTRRDLHDDLLSRGVEEAIVVEVLDRFTEVGLIDDAAYARLWSSSRQRVKGNARSLIRQELRRKGVADADIEGALAEIDDESEWSRGVALVRSRLASTRRLDDQARYRRLLGMLMRRGYSGSRAHGIIREALGEADAHLDGVQIEE